MPECNASTSAFVDSQAQRFNTEFFQVAHDGRHGASSAMSLGAAFKGLDEVMKQLPCEAAKTDFVQKLGKTHALDSEYSNNVLPELALVYMQEMKGKIDTNYDGNFSREELTDYSQRRSLNPVEKMLVDHAVRSFDSVRNADQADTTSYGGFVSANSENVTLSDVQKELLRIRRNRAKEG